MTTILCSHCKLPHALFWEQTSEHKKTLRYVCDRVPRRVKNSRGSQELRYQTFSIALSRSEAKPYLKDPTIPIKWTKKFSRLQQDQVQASLL